MTAAAAKTVSIKLSEGVHSRIKRLAGARSRTAHWLMREAIESYVDVEEKRQAFLQETLAAWEEYEKTGLHATAEEVDAWLAKLEAGHDVEPPQCHP